MFSAIEDGEKLRQREKAIRRILSGPCFYREGRWFATTAPQSEVDAHCQSVAKRRERNRRTMENRRERRRMDELEARIARMAPWIQTHLYGRTAVTTEIDGKLCPVDYRRTYGQSNSLYDVSFLAPQTEGDLKDFFNAIGKLFDGLEKSLVPKVQQGKPDEERIGYLSPGEERQSRLALERRKAVRRATAAECPTATDIRVRWELRREDPLGYLRLGALLLDLECYVDNSLVIREMKGKDVSGDARQKIVRRLGGIRQWLKDNCWELADKYKTLMRYKSQARKCAQILDIPDPFPLSELFQTEVDPAALCARKVHLQPRSLEHHTVASERFDWESRPWREDADGRSYHLNFRYSDARFIPMSPTLVATLHHSVVDLLDQLLQPIFTGHDAAFKTVFPNSRNCHLRQFLNGNWCMNSFSRRLDTLLREHEEWWSRHDIINSQNHMVMRL